MVARPRFLHLAEDFFQGVLAHQALGLGSHLKLTGLVLFGNVALILHLLNEVAHAVLIVGEAVLIVQAGHPLKHLRQIARGDHHQFHKDFQQLVKGALPFGIFVRNVFGKSVS